MTSAIRLLANTSKLEAIEGYMTYHMGLTIQAEKKAIQTKIAALETRP